MLLATLSNTPEMLHSLQKLYSYNARDAIISASDLYGIDCLEAAELLTGNRWAIIDCKSGQVRYTEPTLKTYFEEPGDVTV